MATFFISHSSRDRAAAEQLRMRLRAEGFESVFLDFDPDDGIPLGRNWELELYRQLQMADALIFLGSPDSAESKWCFAELALARAARKPIFPILVAGSRRHPLLDDTQWIDLGLRGDTGMQSLWNALERGGFDPRDSYRWDPHRSPYPGLSPFEPEDAAMFFGRSEKIDELLDHLQPTLKHADGRLIAVIGASGTGKSSLVRAGLIPRLHKLRDEWVVIPPFAPGARPIAALARSFALALSGDGRRPGWRELVDAIERDPGELANLIHDLRQQAGGTASVLLVVDQAEELATLADSGECASFVETLGGALEAKTPMWVVATFRSEFLTTSLEDSTVAALIGDSIVLGPLDRGRIPEVIEGPARRVGVDFDPGLVGRMVEDTRGGDALPLLAYTLQQLYERAGPSGRITTEDYEAIGGVLGALKRSADRVARDLERAGKGDRIIPTLLELVRLDGGTEPARARVLRSELDETENTIVQAFVDARLLKSEGTAEDATIEVAHEALLRAWTPLSDAIDASRDDLRIRSDLERASADWDRSTRDDDLLFRGARLQRTLLWRERSQPALAPVERSFLDSSSAAEATELRSRRQRRRSIRVLALAVGVFLVLATFAALLAVRETRRAESRRQAAVAARVAGFALDSLETRPHLAALLALEAYRAAEVPEARSAALAALRRHDGIAGFLELDEDAFTLAFSPGGTSLAAATDNVDKVTVWDVARRRLLGELDFREVAVQALSLRPDGRRFAVILEGGTLELWRVGRPSKRLWSRPADGLDVAFASTGQQVVVVRQDDSITLWDLQGRISDTLRPEVGPLGKADVLTVDGSKVALRVSGGTTVWDLTRRARLGRIVPVPRTDQVLLSGDGTRLLSFDEDQTRAAVWDVAAADKLFELELEDFSTSELALDAAGKTLAVASLDGIVTLYDVATKERLGEPLQAPGDTAWAAAFSPDGKALALATDEAIVALWDTTGARGLSTQISSHESEGSAVAFAPDGELLASAAFDETLRFWDPVTLRPVGRPLQLGGTASALAFGDSGRQLAVGAEGGILRLWDVERHDWDGEPLVRQEGPGNPDEDVEAIGYAPRGPLLAVGGGDGTVSLWHTGRREPTGGRWETSTTIQQGVALSASGVLAWGDGRDVRLWDTRRRRPIGPPLPHSDDVSFLVFSPDGTTLASGTEAGSITLWELERGRALGEPLRGHREDILGLAFTADGGTLASASIEGTVRLWDVATRRPLGEPLTAHGDDATGVAFSPDGKALASVGSGPELIVWDALLWSADRAALERRLCPVVGRNLTRVEWDEFMPDEPYHRTCEDWPPGS